MKWDKIKIINNEGVKVDAQAPVIISASRATDIPAFYSDWFIDRLKVGYLRWKNPFNSVYSYVSFKNIRAIIFWSKNPKPIMKHLDFLEESKINYYFQFTLNDYDLENIERNVPMLEKRIETFIELSEKIGKEKIIWRFDPFVLTNKIGVDDLLTRVEKIGNQLKNYTNKFVFSFADIGIYKKVENTLKKENISYLEFSEQSMNEMAQGIVELNKNWNFEVSTCAEKINFDKYGIAHNKCIDDDLMIKLFSNDEKLMNFLGVKTPVRTLFDNTTSFIKTKNLKDKGQREACGCIMSKDIGQYNTCPFGCVYCYANTSLELPIKNYKLFKNNPSSETITEE